ncbi:MAG: S9 family peptidase [Ignavibacteriae bacterium]|nr:S9 family peptidase [Ignavibacteriota bacterium]
MNFIKGIKLKKLLSLSIVSLFCLTIAFSQSKDILPGDNLTIDGIPAIPSSIAEEVSRYTEFRSASFSSWHPTKHEMLISTRFGDVPQVHYVKFPGGARTQMTFFPERIGGASFNPKNENYFIFSKDVGGGEWFQIFRFDISSGNVTMLTDGKSRNLIGSWSRDGKWLAYSSTRRNNKDLDVYVINPLEPSSDKMLCQLEGGGWSVGDWSPDGKWMLLQEGISVNESYLYLVDVATGEKSLLTSKDGKEQVAYGGGQFTNDGKGFYVTSDLNSEFRRLVYFDIALKKQTPIVENLNWDVDGFSLSDDGKRIAYISNEDGISVLHVLDVATKKELPLPKLPVGLVGGIGWHSDNTTLALNINSARSTNDVYSLDVTTGKLERWTESETGGLNVSNFPEPELIKWKSFDGKMISGFLYKPPAKFSGKYPVIVNIHGGPEGQSRPGFLGRNNYFLNEMGVAMIFPNIRGSTGYGKTFVKLDNGFKREDSYKDLEALLDWIKQQLELDGDRIMITGGSYGGHMTLAVSTFYSDKIRCSIDIVGMSNLVTFLERTEAYRRDLRRVEYGDERDEKMREYLNKIAPLNNVENIKKPMFVIQGKNDPRVPYTEADQIVASLKKSNTPVWYLMANDEGHGFAKKKNQDFQFYSTVLFMREFLLK